MLFVTLLCSPVVASAQDPTVRDALPFRRGQWAAQFAAGFSFASLGVVRFTAPARAWLLDLRLSGGHSHGTSRMGDSVRAEGYTSEVSFDARIGRRFYQDVGKAVVSLGTIGMFGGYDDGCAGNNVTGDSCTNGWRAGVVGDLGAAYLVTSRFSIGGTGSVTFSYARSTSRGPGGLSGTSWSYRGSVQGPSFVATIYF